LCAEYRPDKTIRAIVHRAKSILAADHTFFSVDSKHQRQKGPEIHERLARVFVAQVLERQPGESLTLSNAYLDFTEFLKLKAMVPVTRGLFKGMFCPLVRETFDLGLRHDVINPETQKQGDGWKGIRALDLEGGLAGQETTGIPQTRDPVHPGCSKDPQLTALVSGRRVPGPSSLPRFWLGPRRFLGHLAVVGVG
jgi:hypothetical protein